MALYAPAARRVFAGMLLASAAAITAACSSGAPSPAPTTPSPSPAPTTPSASPAASTPAATPQTSAPAAVPGECPTAGLHVAITYQQGAAGTIYYNINFTNISGTACVLQGYPGVSLVTTGSDAGSQIGSDAKRDTVTPVTAITVPPGQTAHAVLGVGDVHNYPASLCQPVTAHWLKVFPPDQYTASYVKFTVETCASTEVATLGITAISAGA